MNVAVVGCGNIAGRYAERIVASPVLELVGATDVLPGRADAFVAEFGGSAYPTLDELLADAGVELVVNLTAPEFHAPVTRAALEAGKHVHSEKPLALRHAEAQELAELAGARGLALSCAPSTLFGEAQQTAWKLIREGAIGRVRVVYAEANWGRIEVWHPTPEAIYGVGAFVDVGVYPLTMVTAFFGPARRVQAFAATLQADRVRLDDTPFHLDVPDWVCAVLELETGVVVRLTATFWVGPGKQRGLEIHGDDGSLHLATWGEADSQLELSPRKDYAQVPLLREPFPGIDWARPLEDLVEAVAEGRAPRAGGSHAAHVVEILDAIRESFENGGRAVEVYSEFEPPPPLEWAR
jgi:predicted dehydrogenase